MKKIALLVVATVFAVAVNAQDSKTKPAAQPAATPTQAAPATATKVADANTKAHVCTAACKGDKHVYAHGEKGHTCTAACTASAKPTPAPKSASDKK